MIEKMEAHLQELQQDVGCLRRAWTQKRNALKHTYRERQDTAFKRYWDERVRLKEQEQKHQRDQQHEREKEELFEEQRRQEGLLRAFYEPRIRALVDQMIVLFEAHDQTISPFWRVRIISPEHLAPPLQAFREVREVYSQAGLQELLRVFLDHAEDTKQGSPLRLEVIRVSTMPPFFTYDFVDLSRPQREECCVYRMDFREEHNLIGHDAIQREVLGAWVIAGGQFCHHVTEYSSEKERWSRCPRGNVSIRVHRPLPDRGFFHRQQEP